MLQENIVTEMQQNSGREAQDHKLIYRLINTQIIFLIPCKNRISTLTNTSDSEAAEKNPTEWKHLQKIQYIFSIGFLKDTSLNLRI